MRKRIKEKLDELLCTMKNMQKIIAQTQDTEVRRRYLANCQEAAIAIGETVEREEPDDEKIVPLLETCCEEAYCMAEQPEEKKYLICLSNLLNQVQSKIQDLPSSFHIVFLPYKAEMWDSLESIWMAFKEDSRCQCYVMPIPYYEFKSETKQWIPQYDGDKFPDYVPITDYKAYDLSKESPEVAFIHNPYDNFNYVTSVEPKYYSAELKKYVRQLIYVPYYVTSGFLSEDELSVYKNMDYMVVQSRYTKKKCLDRYYYNKMLPFGSPKLDRLIRLCQEKKNMPDEWRSFLEGKKVLMLNTSINCFLRDSERILAKLQYVFEIFQEQNRVGLIWRPHPLLEATIQSLRPHLMSQYKQLVNYFIVNKIGVLDQTVDIEKTVALSDGYIGEDATSIINLFGVSGKPIFILNNVVCRALPEHKKRTVILSDVEEIAGKYWGVTSQYNALFSLDLSNKTIHFIGQMEGQAKWNGAFLWLEKKEDKLYLSPYMAGCAATYSPEVSKFQTLPDQSQDAILGYRKMVVIKDSIWYLPGGRNRPLMEWNVRESRWDYYTLEQLISGFEDVEEEAAWDCVSDENDLWIIATYTNKILKFDTKNKTCCSYQIGEMAKGYSGIVSDGEFLWLAEVQTGTVLRWNKKTGEIATYLMPQEMKTWELYNGRKLVHVKLINTAEYIVTIPGLTNCSIRIDKVSGKVDCIAEDFWENSYQKQDNYNPRYTYAGFLGKRIEKEKIIVQRTYDQKIAIIDVKKNTYESFDPVLSDEDYKKLLLGEDGFEKIYPEACFCRREGWMFYLEDFIKDIAEDKLQKVSRKQIEAYRQMADNLDGTCGEKVYKFIRKNLEML